MLILKTETDLQFSINEVCAKAEKNLDMMEEQFDSEANEILSSQSIKQFKQNLEALRSILKTLTKLGNRKTSRMMKLHENLEQLQKEYKRTVNKIKSDLYHDLKNLPRLPVFYRCIPAEDSRIFADEFQIATMQRLSKLQDLLAADSTEDLAPFVSFDITDLAIVERHMETVRNSIRSMSGHMIDEIREEFKTNSQFDFEEYFRSKRKEYEDFGTGGIANSIARAERDNIIKELKKRFVENESFYALESRVWSMIAKSLMSDRCQKIFLSHLQETYDELYEPLKRECSPRKNSPMTDENLLELISSVLSNLQFDAECETDQDEIRFAISVKGGQFQGYTLLAIDSNVTKVTIAKKDGDVKVKSMFVEIVEATHGDQEIVGNELHDLNVYFDLDFTAAIERLIEEIKNLIK